MTSHCKRSTRSTPPTSTNSSSNDTAAPPPSSPPTVNQSNGSRSWPTRYSPNRRSTGSNPLPTNSFSTASPTVNANDQPSPPTARLTNRAPRRDHQDADADPREVVPSHWRTGGPI